MASILAFAGPMMSIAGGLFGMAGGGPQPPPAPNLYQFTGMGTADPTVMSEIGAMAGTTSPLAQSTLANLYNNPFAPAAQAAAGTAGAMGMGAGMAQYGSGAGFVPAGMEAIPYANMALSTAFDPQSQVYNQLFQQQTDQTRAAEAARGIANTPYGAGVETQSDIAFNQAWQQNLAARQAMGAQTYGNLLTGGAGATGFGTGQMAAAPGTFFGGGAMPYNVAQNIGQNQLGAITGFQNIQQQPIQDYLSYLGAGTAAQGQQVGLYQAQVQAAKNQQQAMMGYGQALGSGLQGLTKAFGGQGQTGSTGIFGTPQPQFTVTTS